MSELCSAFAAMLVENWTVWLVTVVLIVAAVIDGFELRVPNWITFPFIIGGWIYSTAAFGWQGLGWSVAGTVLGMSILMAFYVIGGMGAGDVKLMGGVGALMAIAMVLIRGKWKHHYAQFWSLLREIQSVKDPEKLSELAAKRKPTMMLLPYGIPIAIATIGYFLWTGMLV